MNHQQRKYLVDKIKASEDITVKMLRNSLPEEPNMSNYLLHAVMSGNFKMQSVEKIKQIITDKALKSKQGNRSWMNCASNFYQSSEKEITFYAEDIFILPEEFTRLNEEYKAERDRINGEIVAIHIQAETLITRITLASDKTLQTMINEVDDMGNISLMDSKIKLLSNS